MDKSKYYFDTEVLPVTLDSCRKVLNCDEELHEVFCVQCCPRYKQLQTVAPLKFLANTLHFVTLKHVLFPLI